MKNIGVISPKCCKQSASRLAGLLGADYLGVVEYENQDFTHYDNIINYGSSVPIQTRNIINKPETVKICVNKISTLRRLAPICPTVEWTKDKAKARDWLFSDGVVVSRALETGSQGKGLTYCTSIDEFLDAPAKFWTRHFTHLKEVRINLFRGSVVSIFDKQRVDEEAGQFFNFIPLKINLGEQIEQMIQAINNTIGIDFCGIDVLVNSSNQCRLLEVNSGMILHPESEKTLVKLIQKELV